MPRPDTQASTKGWVLTRVVSQSPRTRLDAGTWGTMGVGLGYAVAAGVAAPPGHVVFAVEGDSAFGFSGMEMETMQRLVVDSWWLTVVGLSGCLSWLAPEMSVMNESLECMKA